MSSETFIRNKTALVTLIAASLVVLISLGVRQKILEDSRIFSDPDSQAYLNPEWGKKYGQKNMNLKLITTS